MRRLTKHNRSTGFSVLDLMIAVVFVFIIVSYVLTQVVMMRKSQARTNAADKIASYLRTARSDSIRRHALEPERMARITILNDQSYNVVIDANGDGVLDAPIVVPVGWRVKMNGPFPRTYMFDWIGRTVDSDSKVDASTSLTFTDDSGTSAVKLSDIIKPAVNQPAS